MKRKIFGLLRRVAMLVLVAWTVVSLVTLLVELVPGDPAVAVLGEQATPEQISQFRQKHGLDRPPFFFSFPRGPAGGRHFQWHGADNRYTDYWRGLVHGDMGLSFRTNCPIAKSIFSRCESQVTWSGVFQELRHRQFHKLRELLGEFFNSRF